MEGKDQGMARESLRKESLGKIWAGLRETSEGRGRTEGLAHESLSHP